MNFDTVSAFAQTWGLVYLFILFLGVLFYAFRPGGKAIFDRAARLPLEED